VEVRPGGGAAEREIALLIDLETAAAVAALGVALAPPTIIAVRRCAGMWRPKCATVVMSRAFFTIAVTNASPSRSRTHATLTGPTPGISHRSPGNAFPRTSAA
jgi:hypothetical protein